MNMIPILLCPNSSGQAFCIEHVNETQSGHTNQTIDITDIKADLACDLCAGKKVRSHREFTNWIKWEIYDRLWNKYIC